MRFVGIIGEGGAGKTTLLTHLLLNAHNEGQPVVANYHLKQIPFDLMPFWELAQLTERDGKVDKRRVAGAVVGMDELAVGADSYEFFASGPQKITKFVAMSRKLNCEVIYTVQFFHMIAARLRQQTQGFIFCEDLDAMKSHCLCPKNVTPFVCKCKGNRYICAGISRLTFTDPIGRVLRVVREWNGTEYRKYFDTDEVVWNEPESISSDGTGKEKGRAGALALQ